MWRLGGFRDQGVEMGRFRDSDGVSLGIRGWRLVGLGVEMGRFRGGDWVDLGMRGWRWVGLGMEMGWV